MYGVFPHAIWRITNHATGDGVIELTNGGYVVREISAAVPYGRMQPIRVYTRRDAADRLSDKLTYGDKQP